MEQNLQHLGKEKCVLFLFHKNHFLFISLFFSSVPLYMSSSCWFFQTLACVTSSLNVCLKVRFFILFFLSFHNPGRKKKANCLNEKEAASLKHRAAFEKSVWICSSSHIKWIRTWLIFLWSNKAESCYSSAVILANVLLPLECKLQLDTTRD